MSADGQEAGASADGDGRRKAAGLLPHDIRKEILIIDKTLMSPFPDLEALESALAEAIERSVEESTEDAILGFIEVDEATQQEIHVASSRFTESSPTADFSPPSIASRSTSTTTPDSGRIRCTSNGIGKSTGFGPLYYLHSFSAASASC